METANCSKKLDQIVGLTLQAGWVVRYGNQEIHCQNFYGSLSEESGKPLKIRPVTLGPANQYTGHHPGIVPDAWIGMNHSFVIIPTTELLALTPGGNISTIYFFSVFY
jgi:hypothetical protein